MKATDASSRAFILATVGVSLVAWQLGFNFGVFNTIFFEHIFAVWAGSMAVLLACWWLPAEKRPLTATGMVALSIPTIWFVVAVWSQFTGATFGWAVFGIGTVVMLVCFPYVALVLASVLQQDAQPFSSKRSLLGLVIISVLIGLVGYLVGHYHYIMLTCHDFEISGNFKPNNCWSGAWYQPKQP